MRRRLLGLVASIVLATFGTVVLVSYVQSAHDEAAAEEPMEQVLVVTKLVPRGTKSSALEGFVTVKSVTASTKIDGAVASLKAIGEAKVTVTDLLPGEQVLLERFDTVKALGRAGVPEGMLEVTVQLSPERAIGGAVRAGDTVAVISSFDPFDIDTTGQAVDPNAPKKTPNTTHVILRKVLVTSVQTTKAMKDNDDEDPEEDDDTPDPAPEGQLLITLALDAASVQRVVFTAEFGTLWLSAEPSDAPETPTIVETRGSIYR